MGDVAGSDDGGSDDAAPGAPLPDGSYDVFIIDANEDDHDADRIVVEVTLIDGEHKGSVLSMGSPATELLPDGGDPIELLGETGVLRVEGGAPLLRVDS